MTCPMPSTAPIKRGDTFLLTCTYKQDGVAVDLTAYTIRSQVRDSAGGLVQELTPTKADQTTDPGVFTLDGGLTTDWPLDRLVCDIEFVEGVVVRSSQTFAVPMVEDVTRD